MTSAAKVTAGSRNPGTAPSKRSHQPSPLLNAVWLVLLVAAVAGTFAAAAQLEQSYQAYIQPFAALGLRVGEVDNELRIVGAYGPPDASQATASGGLILSVDGRPAPTRYQDRLEVGRLLADAPGPVVRLRVLSRDGRSRDLALQRSGGWLTAAYAGSGWTRHGLWIETGVANTILHAVQIFAAVLLFTRARRQPVAVLLSISFLMMAASGSFSSPTYTQPLWGPFALAPPLLGALAIGGIALGLFVFPDGRPDPPWLRWGLPFLVALVVVDALYGYGIVAASWISWPVLAVFLLAVAVQVRRYRRLPAGEPRQQLRWALFGTVGTGVCFLALAVVLAWQSRAADDILVWAWLTAAVPVLVLIAGVAHMGGLVVSLLRYRLYDVDTVISRSAAFAIVTVALAAIWAGVERALEVVLEGSFGREAEALSVGLAAAIAAVLINPLHERAHRWAEHVFHKTLSQLRRDLPVTVADLRETASVATLAGVALEGITEGVRASRGAIVLAAGQGLKPLAAHGASLPEIRAWLRAAGSELVGQQLLRGEGGDLFPLRLPLTVADHGRRNTVGWLLLGPRPDGSYYVKDELDTLAEVAEPVARALQITRIRHARERAQENKLAGLGAQVAAVRDDQHKLVSELERLRELLAQKANAIPVQ